MKKILLVISLLLLSACQSNSPRADLIPHVFIQNDTYFTNDPRTMESELPEDYYLLGTISKKVEGYEQASTELSTNNSEYMDKNVYVNSQDLNFVYIELHEGNYLKLHNE